MLIFIVNIIRRFALRLMHYLLRLGFVASVVITILWNAFEAIPGIAIYSNADLIINKFRIQNVPCLRPTLLPSCLVAFYCLPMMRLSTNVPIHPSIFSLCVFCRDFVAKEYPALKQANPTLPILIREASQVNAAVYARYGMWSTWRITCANGCIWIHVTRPSIHHPFPRSFWRREAGLCRQPQCLTDCGVHQDPCCCTVVEFNDECNALMST